MKIKPLILQKFVLKTGLKIFLVALVFRLLLLLLAGFDEKLMIVNLEAQNYKQIAHSLLNYQTFSSEANGTVLDFAKTPLYPLILAFFLFFTDKIFVFVIFQVMVSALSCVLVYKITQKFLSEKDSQIAGFLFAFDFLTATYSVFVLPETVFLNLLLFFSLYFSEAVLEKSVKKMAVASLFLGLTTLCKPIGYYFFFVAIFTLIFYHRKNLPRTPRLTLTIIFIYFLTLFPWLIRNYLALGYFEFTQYRQTEIFLRRVADNLLNEQKFYYEEPFLEKNFIGVLKIYPEKIIENAFEGLKGSFLPEKKLSKIITCNKDWETSLYDTYVTKGVFQTVFTIFYRGKIGFLQVVLLISQFIFDFGIYFFAFLGFFTFARKKHPFKVLAIFTFVYFSVYACLSEPKPKFRIPFVPVLMICAAIGIGSLTSQTKKDRK